MTADSQALIADAKKAAVALFMETGEADSTSVALLLARFVKHVEVLEKDLSHFKALANVLSQEATIEEKPKP
jgi:hypothetical protein